MITGIRLIDKVRPKTFCDDFVEQIDIAERLYGRAIRFDFDRKVVTDIVNEAVQYSEEIRQRVINTIMQMRRKYDYVFG